MTSRFILVAAALLTLCGCDRLKALLPESKSPPPNIKDQSSADFVKRAAAEAPQLKLHPDVARREGALLTIYSDGKAVASFQNHMEDCVPVWPVCEGWTYLDTLDVKNPSTGKIEPYPRVTWSYGKITNSDYVPTATYLVDHEGLLHYVGDSQPVYSPSHSLVATQEPFLSHGIVILDWTDASNLKTYVLPTLLTADSWADDSHIDASVVADQGLALATINRQSDGGWQIVEKELYPDIGDRETPVKPGAKVQKLNERPQLVDAWRDPYDDMALMGPHGYVQLFSYSAKHSETMKESATESASVNPR